MVRKVEIQIYIRSSQHGTDLISRNFSMLSDTLLTCSLLVGTDLFEEKVPQMNV